MKGMTMEWQNPSPVARYCTGCGCPMIAGRQVTTAATAAEMDDTNTWAMCPVCGATLIDIDGFPNILGAHPDLPHLEHNRKE
jgi:hypothetical protein